MSKKRTQDNLDVQVSPKLSSTDLGIVIEFLELENKTIGTNKLVQIAMKLLVDNIKEGNEEVEKRLALDAGCYRKLHKQVTGSAQTDIRKRLNIKRPEVDLMSQPLDNFHMPEEVGFVPDLDNLDKL